MSDTEPTTDTPEGLRAAHKAATEGRTAAEQEAARLRKENLFLKAKIDITDDGAGQLLFDAWDGGDDLEALTAKATKVGALKAPTTPDDPAPTTEQRQQQQMSDVMRGDGHSQAAATDPAEHVNPGQKANKVFRDALQEGETLRGAQLQGFGAFMQEVRKGNPRTRFNQAEHAAAAAEYEASH